MPGVLIGAWLFAVFYPGLEKRVLKWGDFGELTLPQLARKEPWTIVLPVSACLIGILLLMEKSGL